MFRLTRTWPALPVLALFCVCAFAGAPRHDRWKVIGPGGGGSIYSPTISPHNVNDMLAYCDMTGAYISHDAGTSWRMFNLRGRVYFFLFDPLDPRTIYAQTNGLWRSTDRGDTWRLVYPDPAEVTGISMPDDHAGERLLTRDGTRPTVASLGVDPADSKTLYALMGGRGGGYHLAVSTDWGKTWKNTGAVPGFDSRPEYQYGANRRVFVDPASPRADRRLYVIAANSVAVREGGAWRKFDAPEGVISFYEYSGGFPKGGGKPVFYATSRQGAFVSRDGGEHWTRAAVPGLSAPVQFSGVAASQFHPEVAYLSFGSDRNAQKQVFGFAKTVDSGRT